MRADRRAADEAVMRRMAAALRHRGPDGFGFAQGPGVALVSTRLVVVDRRGGWQPLRGPRGSVLVYNGEAFNHVELRAELERAGARLRTASDTEVVLELLERHGVAALHRLEGQFALAWWEPGPRRLTLARDTFGVHPLLTAPLPGGGLAFASEAKALFASGQLAAAPDLEGLDEVWALWGTQPPRTAFRGVEALGPGEVRIWEHGRLAAPTPWTGSAGRLAAEPGVVDPDGSLEPLLRESVRLRMRADVRVGAYLSGGLDSSVVCALAQDEAGEPLDTFSLAFTDPAYDERSEQAAVSGALGTAHRTVEVGPRDLADALPAVIRHVECPMVRTAPVPLWLLARAARADGVPVIATGEGADELFLGYDLFKEVALRELHARDPAAARRGLDALYPYLAAGRGAKGEAWRHALLDADPADPLGSHRTRAAAGTAVRGLYAEDVRGELAAEDPLDRLAHRLPVGFAGWTPLDRAAHLELTTLLPNYLLSTQGDRVAMAHGVEARYPFLDRRVAAYAAALPGERKLAAGGRDKVELRELARAILPPVIAERPKLPYRAPGVEALLTSEPPDWVAERLSPAAVASAGVFDPGRVATLVRRGREGRVRGVREGIALVGVLTTQLWHETFLAPRSDRFEAEPGEPRVRLDLTPSTVAA